MGGNRSARRKPTTFGKALTYSFHMSVMSEVLSEDRTQDSEVKGACSDDCATEAPDSHGFSCSFEPGLKSDHFVYVIEKHAKTLKLKTKSLLKWRQTMAMLFPGEITKGWRKRFQMLEKDLEKVQKDQETLMKEHRYGCCMNWRTRVKNMNDFEADRVTTKQKNLLQDLRFTSPML